MVNKNYEIKDESLNQVSGGGIFSSFNDEDYEAAGIEIIDKGIFYNDGYRYRGQEITTEQANAIACYHGDYERNPSSIQEAVDYYTKKMIDEYF